MNTIKVFANTTIDKKMIHLTHLEKQTLSHQKINLFLN